MGWGVGFLGILSVIVVELPDLLPLFGVRVSTADGTGFMCSDESRINKCEQTFVQFSCHL